MPKKEKKLQKNENLEKPAPFLGGGGPTMYRDLPPPSSKKDINGTLYEILEKKIAEKVADL